MEISSQVAEAFTAFVIIGVLNLTAMLFMVMMAQMITRILEK